MHEDATLEDRSGQISIIQKAIESATPNLEDAKKQLKNKVVQLSGLQDRIKRASKRYSEHQGSAHTALDQANTTQLRVGKSTDKVNEIFRTFEAKLGRSRRLAARARSLLDLNYAAAAYNPVPVHFPSFRCVYTMVPYQASKSRVFDISFWFRPRKIASDSLSDGRVLLVGRRAFVGRTQMFAFTLEPNNMVRFSWNVAGGEIELGPVVNDRWYSLRATSIAGETRFFMQNLQQQQPSVDTLMSRVSSAGHDDPETALLIDRLLEIRVGGPHQQGEVVSTEQWGANGAEALWERLIKMANNHGACIANLRIQGRSMGLVNFARASMDGCSKPSKFSCQYHIDWRELARNGYIWQELTPTEGVNRRRRPLIENYDRQDPNLAALIFFDFAGGNGYARLGRTNNWVYCGPKKLQFYLAPLPASRGRRMAMTFFSFDRVRLLNLYFS
ncbi:unnamed protein product [Protopolystoma xenopodis]|uniref:Uncharacterized protein n=1 Tax=Protopolystoma xenopodis TaxID=117903 RepID=A0A3S5BRI5_9PLAT|nr:unnamed protein product [Protopolystoma xenopodis]